MTGNTVGLVAWGLALIDRRRRHSIITTANAIPAVILTSTVGACVTAAESVTVAASIAANIVSSVSVAAIAASVSRACPTFVVAPTSSTDGFDSK